MDSALRRARAIETVEAWILGLPGQPRQLDAVELKSYPNRQFTSGWRIEVSFPDRTRRLDLLVDDRFPREASRVGVIDRPEFLAWPHLEKDGVLCVFPDAVQVAVNDPSATAQNVLGSACHLIEASAAGRNEDDFADEFLSYWCWDATVGAPIFYSLIKGEPPTRYIRVWCGQPFYLVADREQEILLWLQHRFGDKRTQRVNTEEAVLLWLDRPLFPREFPRTASDMLTLAQSMTQGGGEILTEFASRRPDKIVVLLGSSTANGAVFAGVTIPAPRVPTLPGGHPHDPLTRGFRQNRVPQRILVQRFLSASPTRRSPVERADAAWVHGRDQDPRFPRLREATVAVLGVGSVGASVALKLVEAGVGRLVLIDPDRLKWANVGRHPLGAPSVDVHKALSLADRIKLDYPHVFSVDYQTKRWEDVARDTPALLSSCDLIVSAMGNWPAEGALNEWHLTQQRPRPIIYGWTEPHACAGHGVAIASTGACFQCGFSVDGLPLLRVTEWPSPTQKREPACGAVYQPYGPIELSHVVAMISDLALDCLLDAPAVSMHRVWVGRRSLLQRLGGDWTQDWADIAGDRVRGAFIEERSWPSSSHCIECGVGAA